MGFRVCYMAFPNLLLLLGTLELEVVLLLELDCSATNTSQSLRGRSEGTGRATPRKREICGREDAYRAGGGHRT